MTLECCATRFSASAANVLTKRPVLPVAGTVPSKSFGVDVLRAFAERVVLGSISATDFGFKHAASGSSAGYCWELPVGFPAFMREGVCELPTKGCGRIPEVPIQLEQANRQCFLRACTHAKSTPPSSRTKRRIS